MGYSTGDETAEFEAEIEHTTAKAYLVRPTFGPEEAWLPKSQTFDMEDLGGGLFRFKVAAWWAKKNGLV